MIVRGLLLTGGGIFVNTPHVPPIRVLFVNTVLVRPGTGVKLNWTFPPVAAGVPTDGGAGNVTTRLAGALVIEPEVFVMITV